MHPLAEVMGPTPEVEAIVLLDKDWSYLSMQSLLMLPCGKPLAKLGGQAGKLSKTRKCLDVGGKLPTQVRNAWFFDVVNLEVLE